MKGRGRGGERRRERLDRGIKVRSDGFYALLSWREISYLLVPRAALVIGLLGMPVFLPEHWQRVLFLAGIYSLLTISFDLLMSFAGLVSLGGALFMGVGGYSAALFAFKFGLPPSITLIMGTIMGGAISTLLLLPCLRLRGIYFAIASFVYPFLIYHILEALNIWGGTEGISGLPYIASKWVSLYLVLVVTLIALFTLRRIVTEDVGLMLRGIRENEQAAKASGINVNFWKTVAVFFAACVGCFAGACLHATYGWVGVSFFALDFSILPIAAAVLGGMGSFSGPVLGALVLVQLTELLRALGPLRMVAYGIILIIFIVVRPGGLMPYFSRKYHQFERWVEV
jgi:branched-chain amino acid transport system permease protein